MDRLCCGIDIGTTNVKVVLVDGEGRTVFTRATPTLRLPDGDAVATDAMALVRLLETMIVEGWRAAGGGRSLAAISTAGVGEDGFGVTTDIAPTGLSLPWFDGRAEAEAAELAVAFAGDERAGIAVRPDRTIAKWLWLARHRPAELREARWWIALTDFPLACWSGQAFMSLSLAARTACCDVFARQWLDERLAAACAPELPPLLPAGAVVGGVRAGTLRDSGAADATTLLVAGGHDHPIASAALKRLDAKARVDSLGTANLAYGETQAAIAVQPHGLLAFSPPPKGGAGMACLGVVEFAAMLARRGCDEQVLRKALAAMRFPGSPEQDSGSDQSDPMARVRRVAEDAAMTSRAMFDAMTGIGVPQGPIFMTGGWSRSRALAQLRASVFGVPVQVVGDVELVATSAAWIAVEAVAGAPPPASSDIERATVEPVRDWVPIYERRWQNLPH